MRIPKREKQWPILPMLLAFLVSFFDAAGLADDYATPKNHIMEGILGVAYAIYWIRIATARMLREKTYAFIPYIILIVLIPHLSMWLARPFDTIEFRHLYREQYIKQ